MSEATGGVILAYVHSHEVAHSWHRSMWALQRWDFEHDQRLAGVIEVRCGFQGVWAARNEGVRRFLGTGLDWMWWVDTDMGFAADTLDHLLAAADRMRRPIVGAHCLAQKMPDEDGLGGYRTEAVSTIYEWVSERDRRGFIALAHAPSDTLIRCAGTGSACILIHRRAFQAIAKTQGACWYDPVPNPEVGGVIGEDLSFCLRCAIASIPVHVHAGIRTNHLKAVWLSAEPAMAKNGPG